MGFKVTARTLLHLGAELISSDSVALFELVKNAFDARSTSVSIDVNVILPNWPGQFPVLINSIKEAQELLSSSDEKDCQSAQEIFDEAVEELRSAVLADYDSTAIGAIGFADAVRTSSAPHLIDLVGSANTIVIKDTGVGMSLDDLNDVYLQIGTRSRLKEKSEWTPKDATDEPPVILGEKGLGRLSVMRLGHKVQVKTSKAGEKNWNNLDIDWRIFSHESDALLETVEVDPVLGDSKFDATEQGTDIRISLLQTNWSSKSVEAFVHEQVSKLTDPFEVDKRYLVKVSFNGTRIPPLSLEKNLAKYAHGYVNGSFDVDTSVSPPKIRCVAKIIYSLRKRETVAVLEESDLTSKTKLSSKQLAAMGPFTMEAYWFNRRLLTNLKESGVKVTDLVKQWGGGLMLFRDGFRVFPYGGPDDDWLDLDTKALASQGYKVNRNQIVGRVNISSRKNPYFRDTTNREGLVDTPETDAFKAILKSILEDRFRFFLNKVEAEETKASVDVDFTVLRQRVVTERDKLQLSFDFLKKKHPVILQEKEVIDKIGESIKHLEQMMAEATVLADSFESGRSQMVHLAALGLTVEMLAHELNRTARYALEYLAEAKAEAGSKIPASFKAIEQQLKTIQKRLSVLDAESISGRQTKSLFDISEVAESVMEAHQSTLDRFRISHSIFCNPDGSSLKIKAVKGMVTQILDNLLDNSIYWLRQALVMDPKFTPRIEVEIDSEERVLYFTDNGPGISEQNREDVFEPFFTSKPPGDGKGLGLYIATELVKYHDAEFGLSEYKQVHPGRLNTFALTFPKK